MKLVNIIIKTAILSTALVLAACRQSDADKDYGFAKIYIPQATVSGLDNSYPIPGGPIGQNSVYNCYFADGHLNIALGVVRSGAIAHSKAFTVDLGISDSETERKLAEYAEKGVSAAGLFKEICTIPARIEVESGKNTGNCVIAVDLNALALRQAEIWQTDKYKLLVLGLAISNPSEYELAESNTSVVIILDLNSKHWDNVPENMPESEIRALFPMS